MTVGANDPVFQHISAKALHPTFGAEISGVDISAPLTDDVFREILQALNKVHNNTNLPFNL
jgi:alpha-ketoglutarate-dependent 2,4-dichlorophenoxyacetate dioxygenase